MLTMELELLVLESHDSRPDQNRLRPRTSDRQRTRDILFTLSPPMSTNDRTLLAVIGDEVCLTF